MSASVFANMNRAELHRIVKTQSGFCNALGILEESRYRFDPASERQILECLSRLEMIVANSRLIDRNEAKSATVATRSNVISLAPRTAWRAEPCPA